MSRIWLEPASLQPGTLGPRGATAGVTSPCALAGGPTDPRPCFRDSLPPEEGGREGGLLTIEIAEEDVLDAAAHNALYLAAGLFPLSLKNTADPWPDFVPAHITPEASACCKAQLGRARALGLQSLGG